MKLVNETKRFRYYLVLGRMGAYDVKIDKQGSEHNCTCEHGSMWRFGKNKGMCWHIKKGLEVLE